MAFADAMPGWDEAYESWFHEARPLLAASRWEDAFVHYPWVKPADTPCTPLARALGRVRLGVVSTAGFFVTGEQAPFTAEDVEGDPTYRVLPPDVKATDLSISHNHYPHDAARADWNAVLPLDHLRTMVGAGELGGLGPVISISGYCTNAARLGRESVEAIATAVREAGCDALLLVPV